MKSLFITTKYTDTDKGLYEFSKSVDFENDCKGTVRIFAACRYILHINGKYVCEGPCRSAEDVRYYETVGVNFQKGKNIIAVTVMQLTDEREFSSCFKSVKPVMIFQACTEYGVVNSDVDWKCEYILSNILTNATSLNPGIAFVPPFENVTGDKRTKEIPVEVCGYFDFEGAECDHYGVDTPFYLEPRPIPIIYPEKAQELKIVKCNDRYIEFDSGEYVTAKVEFDLKAGHTYKILYAECYQFGDKKYLRDDYSGELHGAYDVVCAESDMTFSPFWYRAFRFVRIECEKPRENILDARAYRVAYPFDITGSFECSDESYNKMWDISINTLKCCAHEIFMDCPFYEQQQYIMDSAIEAAVTMRLTQDVRLIKKCISEFAASQQPSGLLCANYPCSYVQIIPGFSFFFVYLLRDYLEYSADAEFALNYIGTIDKIFSHFNKQIRKKGYIYGSRYWDYQDWVSGWAYGKAPVDEGEAITLYNMYYACALKDAAYICRKTGRTGTAEDYEKQYNNMKSIINSLCFNEKNGMYRDGTNCDSYSVHTSVWAILSEVVTEENAEHIKNSLFDMNICRASFSMNYYLFRAIEKCGIYNRAYEIINNWKKMIDDHCTTWCEEPNNPRSECHAWSSAPVYEFSSNILGVKYSFENEIKIEPNVWHLEYAKGRVPTRFGLVDVDWSMKDSVFTIVVNSPDGVCKKLTMPDGTEYTFTEKRAVYSYEIDN